MRKYGKREGRTDCTVRHVVWSAVSVPSTDMIDCLCGDGMMEFACFADNKCQLVTKHQVKVSVAVF